MELSEYLSKERGRVTQLAQHIDAHIPSVSAWASGSRPVPIKYCLLIEGATSGEVTRRELRPDDWHLIWPELKEPSHA